MLNLNFIILTLYLSLFFCYIEMCSKLAYFEAMNKICWFLTKFHNTDKVGVIQFWNYKIQIKHEVLYGPSKNKKKSVILLKIYACLKKVTYRNRWRPSPGTVGRRNKMIPFLYSLLKNQIFSRFNDYDVKRKGRS